MEFQSILYADTTPNLLKEIPDFFHDLQLDYLLEKILEQAKGYKTYQYFYSFPGTKELIFYRQQVVKDIESEKLCDVLYRFCRNMQESRKIHRLSLECEGEIQAATYHLQAASLYWKALLELEKALQSMESCLNSDGMRAFFDYVKKEVTNQKAAGFENALHQAEKFFSELSFRLSLDPDKLIIAEVSGEGKQTEKVSEKREKESLQKNYFEELAELLGQKEGNFSTSMSEIFPDPLYLSHFEEILIGLLKKSKPQVFKEIRVFQMNFQQIYSPVLLRFEEEIQFYLCFQKFKTRTRGMGYPMELPRISENQEFSGQGVYDLALVWKQEDSSYQVVSNDFAMKQKPCFFVVTGPNQGGKTTFARSMGQAVYFMLMGLSANAEKFSMPMLRGISTHFEAEEKLQSNSGKLKEEINRLIPMMSRTQNCQNFVILNELFTTATTHDAMIMGRKVMESFLGRECYGIYVTHIQELAEETENIISLVAQLEPGQENKRTYRMLPIKAQGYGYSDALVRKFRLEYEDIMRRLS